MVRLMVYTAELRSYGQYRLSTRIMAPTPQRTLSTMTAADKGGCAHCGVVQNMPTSTATWPHVADRRRGRRWDVFQRSRRVRPWPFRWWQKVKMLISCQRSIRDACRCRDLESCGRVVQSRTPPHAEVQAWHYSTTAPRKDRSRAASLK